MIVHLAILPVHDRFDNRVTTLDCNGLKYFRMSSHLELLIKLFSPRQKLFSSWLWSQCTVLAKALVQCLHNSTHSGHYLEDSQLHDLRVLFGRRREAQVRRNVQLVQLPVPHGDHTGLP